MSSHERTAAELDQEDRLRRAVRERPSQMTLQLARELGVPELEVIRAFPANSAVQLDIARWENLIRSLEAAGPVRVLVSSGAATIEVAGRFGGFSTTGEFFNVQTPSLDLHLRWTELQAAFAVEKPGHLDGQLTHSIQFFDRTGCAAMKVFLSFGEQMSDERAQFFRELKERFRSVPSANES